MHERTTRGIKIAGRVDYSRVVARFNLSCTLIGIHPQSIAIHTTNRCGEKSKADKCRDSKDNFLLNLAIDSKADYLVTGDNDLLEIKFIEKTKILTNLFQP